jgi:glutaredoxin
MMVTTTRCRLAVVRQSIGCALLACVLSPAAQAQGVYRIVGPDGKVSFSDQPPPDAKNAARVAGSGAATGNTGPRLPFELQQLVAKYPVTLYSTPDCAPCNSGRGLLVARGIPFTEKTVETKDDLTAFARINPDNALPLLMVGAQPVKGFSGTEWGRYLDAAGYPKTSALPPGYRQPAPQPLVPVKVAPVSPANAAHDPPADPPSRKPPPATTANPNNPAGIKF